MRFFKRTTRGQKEEKQKQSEGVQESDLGNKTSNLSQESTIKVSGL